MPGEPGLGRFHKAARLRLLGDAATPPAGELARAPPTADAARALGAERVDRPQRGNVARRNRTPSKKSRFATGRPMMTD